jgi:hypothetical protein
MFSASAKLSSWWPESSVVAPGDRWLMSTFDGILDCRGRHRAQTVSREIYFSSVIGDSPLARNTTTPSVA